jgi:hypothetical protein
VIYRNQNKGSCCRARERERETERDQEVTGQCRWLCNDIRREEKPKPKKKKNERSEVLICYNRVLVETRLV